MPGNFRDPMKVLRAAAVLGLSTPLVVLACGSDDDSKSRQGEAGAAGEGGDGAGAVGTGGSSAGRAGAPAGGEAPNGGAKPVDGGAGGSVDAGAGGGEAIGGAGGVGGEPEPACGDAAIDSLICFGTPKPLTVIEGTPSDVAIGEWDGGADGLEVLIASNAGLLYYAHDATDGWTTATSTGGPAGAVLGVGQLDSGSELDAIVAQANSGSSTISFGVGDGQVGAQESSWFNSEGVLFNYFVADVAGSGTSLDLAVTFANSVQLVLTTGTEGEGFLGPIAAVYPPSPQDAVVAKLGSSQWLIYSTETNITRQLMTFDDGSVVLGDALPTPAGGPAAQLDVADFNEDGFDDVAATLTASGDLRVLFGDGVGTGGFATVVGTDAFLTLTVGTSDEAKTQRDVKAGDFNGDGHTDLAVSVEGLDAVAIFSGDGEGAFTGPELVSTGVDSAPTRLAVGDLNDDAVDDLAVVTPGSNQLVLLLSEP
jgi:hypothetical protein